MMATISQQNSDNLSSVDKMNQSRWWIDLDITEIANTEPKTIVIPSKLNLEDDEKYYLLKYIKETKDEETWKTVEELLLSKESTDVTVSENISEDWSVLNQEDEVLKWKWMSKQILIAVLEQETLKFDDDGNIESIWWNKDKTDESIQNWQTWYWQSATYDDRWRQISERKFIPTDLKDNKRSKESQAIMDTRIRKNLWSSLVSSQLLSWLDTKEIVILEQSIRSVSEAEEGWYKKINDITENIIATMNKVDRAGRRWDPKFLAYSEKATDTEIPGQFNSWGRSIDIIIHESDTDYITIKWLDIKFNNLEDWLRAANLINWIQWHHLVDNPGFHWKYFFGSRTWALFAERSLRDWGDVEVLDDDGASWVEDAYPELTTKNNQNKFLNYINSL
jgi:hypothetical protein